jgi:hypothetical protein
MIKANILGARVLGAWLLAYVTAIRAACAQDDAGPEPAKAVVRQPRVPAVPMQLEVARVPELRSRQRINDRFDKYLNARVESLCRSYGLSEPQKKKLLLAGRVDIKRFFDRVEVLQKQPQVFRNNAGDVWQAGEEIRKLSLLPSEDLFDEHSMFAKVLANTLTKEQAVTYQRLERELASRRHRATLDWVLGTWDHSLGLNAGQHQRLLALFEQETRPPKKFGTDDYFGLLCQVSRVPEATLKSILNDSQWTKLKPEFAQAKQMEPMLKQTGYVPEPDVAAAPRPADAPEIEAKKERG